MAAREANELEVLNRLLAVPVIDDEPINRGAPVGNWPDGWLWPNEPKDQVRIQYVNGQLDCYT
jgi:hypothetical protein